MNSLSNLSKNIRIENGLYSLNDLHKASGGKDKHAPFRFMRNAQTRLLINEIEQTPDLVLAYRSCHGGKESGTWVCKELVYAYAMWISAEFYLNVIRTFDLVQSKNTECMEIDQIGYVQLLERQLIQYEKKMNLIHSHSSSMKREFAETVFPALKVLNPRLYGNAYERLHVIHMTSMIH